MRPRPPGSSQALWKTGLAWSNASAAALPCGAPRLPCCDRCVRHSCWPKHCSRRGCPARRYADRLRAEPGRWLRKPLLGAGGRGISFWHERSPATVEKCYFQEWIDGESCAAAYLTQGEGEGEAQLLGVTRQLIGLSSLNAGPFQYCGSVGPLPLAQSLTEQYRRIGNVLARDFGLRGLFGVDCVVRDGVVWPVEVNPRYTASMEIIEWALGQPLLAQHAAVFGVNPGASSASKCPGQESLGKAVMFAKDACAFPREGPWCETLAKPWQPWEVPDFADIPATGQRCLPGQPILTTYARAGNIAECVKSLEHKAREIAFQEQ